MSLRIMLNLQMPMRVGDGPSVVGLLIGYLFGGRFAGNARQQCLGFIGPNRSSAAIRSCTGRLPNVFQ